jgi:hypothetical protein
MAKTRPFYRALLEAEILQPLPEESIGVSTTRLYDRPKSKPEDSPTFHDQQDAALLVNFQRMD